MGPPGCWWNVPRKTASGNAQLAVTFTPGNSLVGRDRTARSGSSDMTAEQEDSRPMLLCAVPCTPVSDQTASHLERCNEMEGPASQLLRPSRGVQLGARADTRRCADHREGPDTATRFDEFAWRAQAARACPAARSTEVFRLLLERPARRARCEYAGIVSHGPVRRLAPADS